MPHRRVGRAVLVLAFLALGLVTGPGVAGACACGAVLADQRMSATQETALVELAEGSQSVTLNIATRSEATEAAFIMPVPVRAKFELADAEVFAELDTISRPRVEYRDVVVEDGESGGGAVPGPGVTVTDHVEVGPYEVAQLAGDDAAAVGDWLATNDFELPAELAGALTPYLAEGWLVIAVRLTPESGTFADGLPSMRFTYPTDEPVYPMRLSATADHDQPLRLYVLADHRMDMSNPAPDGAEPDLTYAGWVSPADLAEYPILAELVAQRRFLTRYDATFLPEYITDDIRLTRAATDEAYRAVVVETRYVSASSMSPVIWSVTIAGALALLAFAVLRPRRRDLSTVD